MTLIEISGLLASGSIALARDQIVSYLIANSDDAAGWMLAAHIHVAASDIASAVSALENGERTAPQAGAFPLSNARLQLQLGQHASALKLYEKASNLLPDDAICWREYAELLSASGKLKRSLDAFRKVIQIESTNSEVLDRMAKIEAQMRQSAEDVGRFAKYLECASRFPSPYIAFAGKPGGVWDGGGTYDALGFPNRDDVTEKKAPGEFRVFLVGDSTIHDSDASYHSTVSGYLQDLFQARGADHVRVYNMGVRSTRFRQMLALVFFKLMDLKPDLILIVAGGTDVFQPLSYDPRPGYPYNSYVIEELYEQFFGAGLVKWNDAGPRVVDILEAVGERLAELRHGAGMPGSDSWEDDVIQEFLSVLMKLDMLAGASKCSIRVCLQPLINTKKNRSLEELGMVRSETISYFSRQYAKLIALQRSCQADSTFAKLSFTDATVVFDASPATIYTDFIHYNDAGKKLMAGFLSELVVEAMSQPQS
jgi:tetratricopeptide (TPR) repeat protein